MGASPSTGHPEEVGTIRNMFRCKNQSSAISGDACNACVHACRGVCASAIGQSSSVISAAISGMRAARACCACVRACVSHHQPLAIGHQTSRASAKRHQRSHERGCVRYLRVCMRACRGGDGGFENASPDGAICMAVIYTVRGVYETYWHRMARQWDAKNRPTTLLILQRDISYA